MTTWVSVSSTKVPPDQTTSAVHRCFLFPIIECIAAFSIATRLSRQHLESLAAAAAADASWRRPNKVQKLKKNTKEKILFYEKKLAYPFHMNIQQSMTIDIPEMLQSSRWLAVFLNERFHILYLKKKSIIFLNNLRTVLAYSYQCEIFVVTDEQRRD